MPPAANPAVSGYANQTYTVEFTVPRNLDGSTLGPAIVVPTSNTDPQQIYRPPVIANDLGLVDVDYVVEDSGDERLGTRGARIVHVVWIESPVGAAASAGIQVGDNVDGTFTLQETIDVIAAGATRFYRDRPFLVPQGSILRLFGFTNPGPDPIKVRLTIEYVEDLSAAQQAICECEGGITGATGATGPTGPTGATGATGASNGGVIGFGSRGISATTTTRFLDPWWEAANALTTDVNRLIMPRAGTLRNLFIHHGIPGGNGGAIVYTILVNGVATALAVSLPSTSAVGSDLVDSIAVVQGDEISCRVTKAAPIGSSPGFITATMELA